MKVVLTLTEFMDSKINFTYT